MKTVSIIPARGGSVGVPRKNIKLLGGKPLIVHTIEASLGCSYIGRTIVSTEDEEIAEVSRKAGAEVIIRPEALAGALSKTQEAVLHVLDTLKAQGAEPEWFALLQPTSPMRSARHITEAFEQLIKGREWAEQKGREQPRSIVSLCEVDHHPYKFFRVGTDGELSPFDKIEYLSAPRQILPKFLRQNGALYLLEVEKFRKVQEIYLAPCLGYLMEGEASIDIDTDLDFKMTEFLFKR